MSNKVETKQNYIIKNCVINLIGFSYVGMPIAVSFARKMEVIGFDINEKKIQQYKDGYDPTNEVGDEVIKNTTVHFTSNNEDLKRANFHIVAFPTPLTDSNAPDLGPLRGATKSVEKGRLFSL